MERSGFKAQPTTVNILNAPNTAQFTGFSGRNLSQCSLLLLKPMGFKDISFHWNIPKVPAKHLKTLFQVHPESVSGSIVLVSN